MRRLRNRDSLLNIRNRRLETAPLPEVPALPKSDFGGASFFLNRLEMILTRSIGGNSQKLKYDLKRMADFWGAKRAR